jgi:VWA domain-containing protein
MIFPGSYSRLRGVSVSFSKAFSFSLVALVVSGLGACSGSEEACDSIACAQNQPPSSSAGGTTGAGGSGSSSPGLVGSGAVAGTAATGLGEEGACREVSIQAESTPVNIHIMLDRSVSMLDRVVASDMTSPTRWDAITSALRDFLNSPQADGAKVSIQFFGLTNGADDCAVEKYSDAAVPMALLTSNRGALIAKIDETDPGSLTPTTPALQGALTYALGVAELPENADRATVVVLASDGVPSECTGVTDSQGNSIFSVTPVANMLREYSQPPTGPDGLPTQPAIRTYIIGTEELRANATTLADAGGGQAFLLGGSGGDVQAQFLSAMLSIVTKPLTCELDVPQTAPDNGERVDFDRVRVSFTSPTGLTREIPRAAGEGSCTAAPNGAWFYDNADAPTKVFFCPQSCSTIGAGTLKVELGCAPTMIVR